MFKYTGKQIVAQIFDHYTVDKETGMVVQVFGWDNRGDHENLREVLYEAMDVKLDIARKHAMETGTDLVKLAKTFFKTRSVRKAIEKATEDERQAMNSVATLKALRVRIHDALDIPGEERSNIVWRSPVSDALMEECSRYIRISLLDLDREYEMETPLIVWNTDANKYYRVDPDLSITEWRVGISSFKNVVDGYTVHGVVLRYLVHHLKDDHTRHFIYFDAGTGSFVEGDGTVYHAKYDDAVVQLMIKVEKLRKELDGNLEQAQAKLKEAKDAA